MSTRNNFDGLRLLAALVVLFSHQYTFAVSEEPSLGPAGLPGGQAVYVFFAMSGYLVTSSWQADPHLGRFLARRFLRIWPAFAVVVVTCSVVLLAIADDGAQRRAAWHYLANVSLFVKERALLPWPVHEVNTSLWTIPYEVRCYLVFVAAALLLRRHLRWVMLAALVLEIAWALWLGQAAITVDGGRLDTIPHMLRFGAFFAFGALLYFFPLDADGLAAATVGGLVLLASGHVLVAQLLLIGSLSIFVGRRSWPVLRDAARFGDISFGVYLWAWPVQQLTMRLLGPGTSYFVLLPVSLACVLPLAWLSWHAIEQPALRLKPRRAGTVRNGSVAMPAHA